MTFYANPKHALASERRTSYLQKTMLTAELLALLVCPQTHEDVTLATPNEISLLNAAIGQGQIRTAADTPAEQPIEGALIRADRAIAYPIRDGIPVMLVSEGLVISHVNLHTNS